MRRFVRHRQWCWLRTICWTASERLATHPSQMRFRIRHWLPSGWWLTATASPVRDRERRSSFHLN
jgi:hypothetical protein